MGDVPEAARVAEVMAGALTDGTIEAYSRHFVRFAEWCEQRSLSPLPASTDTVLRWLAGDVCAGSRVQAKSLKVYLSAINTLHADLEMERPAVGRRIQRFRAGLAKIAGRTRSAARTYVPAWVVERAHLRGLAMSNAEAATDAGKRLLQAIVGTVFTFASWRAAAVARPCWRATCASARLACT